MKTRHFDDVKGMHVLHKGNSSPNQLFLIIISSMSLLAIGGLRDLECELSESIFGKIKLLVSPSIINPNISMAGCSIETSVVSAEKNSCLFIFGTF